MKVFQLVLVLASLLLAQSAARADNPALAAPAAASLFDPARHMHVADVKPGMKGYGLTVFSGSELTKFNIHVVGIVKNFNMKYDAVLIQCDDDYLQHTGSIAGMSGSPIYVYGEDGKPRMLGAFAYGWPLAKDPLAGVQPIEYMLQLPANEQKLKPDDAAEIPASPAPAIAAATDASGRLMLSHASQLLWSIDDLPIKPWLKAAGKTADEKPAPLWNWGNLSPTQKATLADGTQIQLQPLATPLMARGLSSAGLRQLSTLLDGTGLIPLEAGGSGADAAAKAKIKLEPGSVLAVPIITGDIELSAVGTCTEVIGNRVFAFGHPFNSEGPIALPMGTGTVATVVANLQESFKLGFLARTVGTLTTDQTVGVTGFVGTWPVMSPIDLTIAYADKSVERHYHFNAASHPKFTPQLVPAVIVATVQGEKNLPDAATLDYDLTIDFTDGHSVHLANVAVNQGEGNNNFMAMLSGMDSGLMEMAGDLEMPIAAASSNPFKHVGIKQITGKVTISPEARTGTILAISLPQSKYEPGDTLKAFVNYQPYRAKPETFGVEMALPRDLPNGQYQLSVSDWRHFLQEAQAIEPFRFNATDIDGVFKVMESLTSLKRNAVYLRLLRQADGIAVGRTALPRLPSSLRQVLADANRSDIAPFVSSATKIVPADMVIEGQAAFVITIERQGNVVPPTSRPTH